MRCEYQRGNALVGKDVVRTGGHCLLWTGAHLGLGRREARCGAAVVLLVESSSGVLGVACAREPRPVVAEGAHGNLHSLRDGGGGSRSSGMCM